LHAIATKQHKGLLPCLVVIEQSKTPRTMMKRIATTFLFGTALLSASNAQITPVGSAPGIMLVVRSLPNAGVKLYSDSHTSLVLYNLDLTPYLTITYPAPPVQWHYYSVLYLTESTFDTDPATIEVMLLMTNEEGTSGTRIITQDGTILFNDTTQASSAGTGYSELNGRPSLFTGEDGFTYMILTNSVPPNGSQLYRLPGELPCLDCTGVPSLGFAPVASGSLSELAVSPNPTMDMVNISYRLPSGTHLATLRVSNAAGQEVGRTALDIGGRTTISLAGHARGTYIFSLMVGQQVLRSIPVIVADR